MDFQIKCPMIRNKLEITFQHSYLYKRIIYAEATFPFRTQMKMSKYTISFYRGFYVKGDCHCERRRKKKVLGRNIKCRYRGVNPFECNQ